MNKLVWEKNSPLIPVLHYTVPFPFLFSVPAANCYCKRERKLSTTPKDFGRILAAVIHGPEKRSRQLHAEDYLKRWVFSAKSKRSSRLPTTFHWTTDSSSTNTITFSSGNSMATRIPVPMKLRIGNGYISRR